jgi:phage virion morphogenesis protein
VAGVTGDFGKLTALIRQLEQVPALKRDVLRVIAEDARTRVDEGFAASRSPEGAAWRPLARARRRGAGRPLLDTGRLRASITYQVTANGFLLKTTLVYAATHQYGWESIPARPYFPEGDVPPAWVAAWRDLTEEVIALHFKGAF